MRNRADARNTLSPFNPMVLIALIGFTSLLSPLLYAQEHKAIAVALKVSGKVNLTKAGTDRTIPLKFGAVLDDGDKVKTGSDGFVTLMFTDDKSQVKITANTEVIIEGKRDVQKNIAKRASVEIGQIFVKTRELKGSLQVATPTSVASVKGTEFWVVVFEDGTTQVVTLDGLVELLNTQSGRIVDVRAGERGQADPQGGVGVEPVPRDQIPPDPDPGLEPPKEIEIEIQDEQGRVRRIILQFEE